VARSADAAVLNRKLDSRIEEISVLTTEVTRNGELSVEIERLQQVALGSEERLIK